MPLFASFGATAARGLGLTSGMPPGAPTINSTTVTPTTIVVNFTKVTGSYTISYFEYSVDGAAYTGSISGSATSFTISGLIPSTSYSITMRGVDVTGQSGPASSAASATTAAEVANSAPVVTLTQLDSDANPLNANKLQWSFAASSGGTYAVSYYQYRLYRGATELTSGWTTTPMSPSTNFTITGLVHNSAHTVDVRAVSATSGLAGTAGTATASTDVEKTYSAPSVTVNSVNSTQATFTRTTPTGGTYAIASYNWRTKNSGGTIVNSGTMTIAETSTTVSVGVGPNEFFTVEVAAVSATTGSVGTYGASSSTQLDPITPTVGTLSWQSGMNVNSTTAQLEMTQPTYSTSATLVISGVGTYSATLSSGKWVWSVAGLGFNQTYSMYAYVTNRIGGSSGNSNTRGFVTPQKGAAWRYPASADYTEKVIALQGTCGTTDIGNMVLTLPSSPSTDSEVGYKYINTISCEFAELLTHRETSGGLSNLNSATRDTQWQIVSGGTPSGWSSAFGIAFTEGGLDYNPPPNFTAGPISYGVYMGGSDISGKTAKVAVNGTGWGQYQSSCSAPTTFAFRARNFYVEGYQTVGGSIS